MFSVLTLAGINSFCQVSDDRRAAHWYITPRESLKPKTVLLMSLLAEDLTNLPVGIKRTVGNTTITIAVDSARITPLGMFIDAYTQIVFPGSATRKISLAAKNILITPAGIAQSAPARLALISECRIQINDKITLFLPANGQNYIDWDCFGFRSVNLSGLFEFSDQYFIPDPELSRDQTKSNRSFGGKYIRPE